MRYTYTGVESRPLCVAGLQFYLCSHWHLPRAFPAFLQCSFNDVSWWETWASIPSFQAPGSPSPRPMYFSRALVGCTWIRKCEANASKYIYSSPLMIRIQHMHAFVKQKQNYDQPIRQNAWTEYRNSFIIYFIYVARWQTHLMFMYSTVHVQIEMTMMTATRYHRQSTVVNAPSRFSLMSSIILSSVQPFVFSAAGPSTCHSIVQTLSQ